jgi:uncharacterized protein (DUF362 family)
VAVKANYNSADPFPASTHIETLRTLMAELKRAGAAELMLAERSGIGNTRRNLELTGVISLAEELDFKVVVLNEEGKESWVKVDKKGTNWLRGFYVAKVFLEADRVVQTCCLKTHRFGGHFTMSLKNSVGLIAKRVPGGIYDYMMELHTSRKQRLKIAELNKFYNVDLIVMDAMKAFVEKGPEKGRVIKPCLLLAGSDRVAVDAVGVAILRKYGSTKNVMKGRIFELDQIRRASELGVGVKTASEIKITPVDEDSHEIVAELEKILEEQG